jgi:pyrophosphatase PpaX
MIKAVIFDIDGVLIESFEANLKFFQELMLVVGFKPPTKEEFILVHHFSLLHLIKYFAKNLSDEKAKEIWKIAQDGKVSYHSELYAPPKNVIKIIKDLHSNYLLGIVTNRIKRGAKKALEFAGIEQDFNVITTYEDTVKHKPNPEPLLLTANRLKVKSEECVYVGDVENDIKAGKAAGMKVIIYSKEQFNAADICTSSFEKLPEIVKSL